MKAVDRDCFPLGRDFLFNATAAQSVFVKSEIFDEIRDDTTGDRWSAEKYELRKAASW